MTSGSSLKEAQKLCAYAGLVPTVHQSASSVRYGGISKDGSKYLRWILTESVHIHKRVCPDSQLSGYFSNISRRRGRQVAIVATARKLLNVIFWMLIRGDVFHSHGLDPDEKAAPRSA